MLPDSVRHSLNMLDFWEGHEIESRRTQSTKDAMQYYIKLKTNVMHRKGDDHKSKNTTDRMWEYICTLFL